jgi:hypothetical protein
MMINACPVTIFRCTAGTGHGCVSGAMQTTPPRLSLQDAPRPSSPDRAVIPWLGTPARSMRRACFGRRRSSFTSRNPIRFHCQETHSADSTNQPTQTKMGVVKAINHPTNWNGMECQSVHGPCGAHAPLGSAIHHSTQCGNSGCRLRFSGQERHGYPAQPSQPARGADLSFTAFVGCQRHWGILSRSSNPSPSLHHNP